MSLDNNASIRSSGVSLVGSNRSFSEVAPFENHSSIFGSQYNFSVTYTSIIPNRVYVRGFDCMMSERDLMHIFSTYGKVRKINIVHSSSTRAKGYGFITYENSEDAQRLLLDENGIYYGDKRLCISQAFRRHHSSTSLNRPILIPDPLQQMQMPCGTVCFTSSGFPYTFYNGVAYFHGQRVDPRPPLWTPPPAPVMVPQPCQPVYHQPAFHHYQPHYIQNHCQWNNVEAPVASAPVICPQPECLHHVLEGAAVHQLPISSLTLMGDTNTEHYDAMMYENYPMYPHGDTTPRFGLPHEYGQSHTDYFIQVPTAQFYTRSRDHPSVLELPEPEPQDPQSAL